MHRQQLPRGALHLALNLLLDKPPVRVDHIARLSVARCGGFLRCSTRARGARSRARPQLALDRGHARAGRVVGLDELRHRVPAVAVVVVARRDRTSAELVPRVGMLVQQREKAREVMRLAQAQGALARRALGRRLALHSSFAASRRRIDYRARPPARGVVAARPPRALAAMRRRLGPRATRARLRGRVLRRRHLGAAVVLGTLRRRFGGLRTRRRSLTRAVPPNPRRARGRPWAEDATAPSAASALFRSAHGGGMALGMLAGRARRLRFTAGSAPQRVTSSTSPSSYLILCSPLVALNAATRPPYHVSSSGQNTSSRPASAPSDAPAGGGGRLGGARGARRSRPRAVKDHTAHAFALVEDRTARASDPLSVIGTAG